MLNALLQYSKSNISISISQSTLKFYLSIVSISKHKHMNIFYNSNPEFRNFTYPKIYVKFNQLTQI